jgi:flagellum-specific peptidoglycan hydrolase FlgJ
MRPFEFLATYRGPVIKSCIGIAIFPSIKMAQAIIETGYGATVKHNNMFGIKARGDFSPFWHGAKILCNTHETINGVLTPVKDWFRDYASIEDSISDHSWFLIDNPRYSAALLAPTYTLQAIELERAGYATGKGYAKLLIQIINQYKLYQLDMELTVRITPK